MTSVSASTLNIDSLVQQYRTSERAVLTPLQNRKTTLNARLNALADLKSKLDALHAQAENFAKTGDASLLSVYKASSSNTDVLSATASSSQSAGNHQVTVHQIAKTDTVISSQLTGEDTSIVNAEGTGVKSFKITVNGVDTTIEVNLEESDSDHTVLGKIANAINAAGAGVNASVIQNTTTTSRLVMTSEQTGSSNAVHLSNTEGTVLDQIGLTSEVISGRQESTDTDGGYLLSDVTALNAAFTINGVHVLRESNNVSDVLEGVTINLKKADANPVTITVGIDTENIRESVEKFIKEYNEALTYLNSRTTIDPHTRVRQIFAGDHIFRFLRMDLRSIVGGPVDSVEEGNPSMLTQIGIGIAADGTLSIADGAKLDELLQENSAKVADIFHSENGVANQLKARLSEFISTGGIIENSRDGADNQINNLNNRIDLLEKRIEGRVQRFRDEFVRLQGMLQMANRQMEMINAISSFGIF